MHCAHDVKKLLMHPPATLKKLPRLKLIRSASLIGNLFLSPIQLVSFAKSQTTPTIIHNGKCYPPSYDMLDFCAQGGQIGRQQLGHIRMWHVAMRCQPTCIVCIL